MKNRIRVRRAELEISQETLSELVGLSRATIIAIEKGKRVPKGDNMLKIAAALETTVNELFF